MSGVTRFLSKREKRDSSGSKQHHHLLSRHQQPAPAEPPQPAIDPSSAVDFYGLFDARGQPNDAEVDKVKMLRQKVLNAKSVIIKDGAILWALRSGMAMGNVDDAYRLLIAMSNASEGLLNDFEPNTNLKGAINRYGVTCFLDSTLFAMFSRLDSFEAMLYNSFQDAPRNKLAFLLRLWVNLLRTGRLITTDITQVIQNSLAECGWEEAAELHQQDASEAFSFITGKLELPLLTLKMDLFHAGKEDAADDHKFINERLLEVAIPYDPSNPNKEITLEDCLEDYFNNRIEVRRYMERRSTINSSKMLEAKGAGSTIHVETVELASDSSPTTPLSASPSHASARPMNRTRTPSIFSERFVPDRSHSGYSSLAPVDTKSSTGRVRAGSIRKEVNMPAWQFFSLIPWYTAHAPSSDAQVAAHFQTKRPVLGLCLKRYAFTADGRAIRLNTRVDIPVEIGLPHFIQDDQMGDDAPLYGNFKLSLQSAVCHRGVSVDSGHYISLVRGSASPLQDESDEDRKHWMRFDDLAPKRVTYVDIEQALREETPYLLFYQIMPVEGDPGQVTAGEKPPSVVISEEADSAVAFCSSVPSEFAAGERDGSLVSSLSRVEQNGSTTTGPGNEPATMVLLPKAEQQHANSRPSLEVPREERPEPILEERRISVPETRQQPVSEERRASVISLSGLRGSSMKVYVAPSENGSVGRSSRGTSPMGRKSGELSRSVSRSRGGLGRTLSKLAGRKPRESVGPTQHSIKSEADIHVMEVEDEGVVGRQRRSSATENHRRRASPPQQVAPIQIPQPPSTKTGMSAMPPQKHQHRNSKEKNRLSKSGKVKDDKPERECILM